MVRWLLTAAVVSAFGGPPARVAIPEAQLSFEYPASWQAQVWRTRTLHVVPLVGVGNVPFAEPCSATATEVRCARFPLGRLPRGGTVVWWTVVSGPMPARHERSNARIGGRRALLRRARPGPCRVVGADETMTARVGPYLRFAACLRGPRLAAADLRVRVLLATTRFDPTRTR